MDRNHKNSVTRRGFFRTVGAVGAAAAVSGLMPKEAQAGVDDLIAKHVGSGSITMEKVNLKTPATAENAALVRMPVEVDHPMDADNYIQSVSLFVDNNPSPFVAQFGFSPEAGKVDVEFRIRMAKTSKVRAIAKTNTGKLYGFVKEIQVAAGGCAS